jgi:2,3-bisphosphoglycerate-dependent phosphoglycerate mutase
MRKRLKSKFWTNMRFTVLSLLWLPIFLASPAFVAAEEAVPVTTVLLVRHAEKAAETGEPPLSHQGRERAEKLVQVAGWAGVKAIYTSEALRARSTAQPLADCLNLKPIIYSEVKGLVGELVAKHAGQVVLVVSHTDWIQQVIDALAGPGSSTSTDSAYDSFHVLTMYAPGKASLLRLKYGETVAPAACTYPQ